MIELPLSRKLPVSALAAAFKEVTNSYKFFWFMAILNAVHTTRNPIISVDALLANMIARLWYPVHYFRLSFGKQDRLGDIVLGSRRLFRNYG